MAQDPVLWRPDAPPPRPVLDGVRLFALDGSRDLGAAIADRLGLPLAIHEERAFEDGEHKARPLDAVAAKDVYVVHGLHGGPDDSPNDKLCRLLFFIGALKDAGAARVTAVVPYLCYARKDRRTKPNDPVTLRYVAQLFEAVGTDALVTLDVHNDAAFENAFRRRTVALTAAPLFVAHIVASRAASGRPLAIVSPDTGGAKRADLLREALAAATGEPIGKGFLEKRRSAGVVSGDLFVGDVAGTTAFLVDDLVATGHTLARAARAARAAGAAEVVAVVTHGLFAEGAAEALADPAIDRIVATDSVPAFRLAGGPARDKLEVVPCAPLIAEAIRRLHLGQPLTDLLVF